MCAAARSSNRNSDDALALTQQIEGEIHLKAKGGYEWIIQLAIHIPASSRLRIRAYPG
jgi:hypothetical protein